MVTRKRVKEDVVKEDGGTMKAAETTQFDADQEIIKKLKAEIITMKLQLNEVQRLFFLAKVDSVDKDKIILELLQKYDVT